MIWVHPGSSAHPMGLHVTQQVWDYVNTHGFRDVVYHRAPMQRQLDQIAAALPFVPRPTDEVLRVGDLVKVGAGKVPWQMQHMSKESGFAWLASTKSAVGRSELVSNLTRLPAPASSPVTTTATAVAKVSRTPPSAAVGAVVGG
jgi:hypothetical protein